MPEYFLGCTEIPNFPLIPVCRNAKSTPPPPPPPLSDIQYTFYINGARIRLCPVPYDTLTFLDKNPALYKTWACTLVYTFFMTYHILPSIPPRGGCHIRAIRKRAADQGILFGLRIRDRVSFFSLTLKQGAKFVRSLRTILFGTLPLVLTYLSFVQEINPSFDVFKIFIVIT